MRSRADANLPAEDRDRADGRAAIHSNPELASLPAFFALLLFVSYAISAAFVSTAVILA